MPAGPDPTDAEPPPRVWISAGCAFVGGYVDVVAYLIGQAFAGHITGNTALIAISLAEHNWPVLGRRALALGGFVVGVVVSAAVDRPLDRRATPRSEAVGFLIEAALLAGAVTGYRLTGGREMFLAAASVALGLQDGNLRKTRGTPLHTTFVSGMLTQAVLRLTGRAAGDRPAPRAGPAAMAVWPTFLAGAVAGAFAHRAIGVAAAWVPAGLLVAFAAIDGLLAAGHRPPGSRLWTSTMANDSPDSAHTADEAWSRSPFRVRL